MPQRNTRFQMWVFFLPWVALSQLFLLKTYYFSFMCMSVLLACMTVYHMHVWCPQESEDVIGSPETGVADCCKTPYRCWELNLGLLQEQQVFLISEPFLQFPNWVFFFLIIPGIFCFFKERKAPCDHRSALARSSVFNLALIFNIP